MLSSNSKLNNIGWASMIRDVENLYMGLQDLGQDTEGQSNSLNTIQQSLATTNTNLTTLNNRLTADEAAIAALQATPASPYKTSADTMTAVNPGSVSCASSAVIAVATTVSGGLSSNYNTSTGVFTAPAAGVYLFCSNIILTSTTAWSGGGYAFIGTYPGGSQLDYQGYSTGGTVANLRLSIAVAAAANDQFATTVFPNSGGSVTYQIFHSSITRL